MRMQAKVRDLNRLPDFSSAFLLLSAFHHLTRAQALSSLQSSLRGPDAQGQLPKAHRIDHQAWDLPHVVKFQVAGKAGPSTSTFPELILFISKICR